MTKKKERKEIEMSVPLKMNPTTIEKGRVIYWI